MTYLYTEGNKIIFHGYEEIPSFSIEFGYHGQIDIKIEDNRWVFTDENPGNLILDHIEPLLGKHLTEELKRLLLEDVQDFLLILKKEGRLKIDPAYTIQQSVTRPKGQGLEN